MFWKNGGRNGFLKGVRGILRQIIVGGKHLRLVSGDLNDELNEIVNVTLLKSFVDSLTVFGPLHGIRSVAWPINSYTSCMTL